MSVTEILRRTALAALASTIAAGPALAQLQQEPYYFRYTNTVFPYDRSGSEGPGDEDDSGVTDPGDADPGDMDPTVLRLNVSMPSVVTAGVSYGREATAAGGETSEYEFQIFNAPDFITLLPDGSILIQPEAEDIGVFSGIVITVSDGVSTVSSNPFSIEVREAGAGIVREHVMPEAVYVSGTQLESARELLYDGKTGTKSRVRLTNNEILEYHYAQPLTATGAFISSSGSRSAVALEAFVDGAWVNVAHTNGAHSGNITGASTTSDRWRLRRTNPASGYVNVNDFRPGPGPTHFPPKFVTPKGPVAIRGMSVQIEATAEPSAYTDAPLTFSFAPGTEVPSGVTLSPSGMLDIASNAAIPPMWNFTLVVTDGVGFKAARDFVAMQDAPMADTIVARKFSGPEGSVHHQGMYDGYGTLESAPQLAQGQALVVDFGIPVRADKAVVGFGAGTSASMRANLQYESNGTWQTLDQLFRRDSGKNVNFGMTAVAQRWRIVSNANYAMNVNEFRIGAGPVHESPTITTEAYIASLMDEPDEATLEAVAGSTYGAEIDHFEMVSGSLPAGSGLSEEGVLDLPSANEVDLQQKWDFVAQVTDTLGFATRKSFTIYGEARSASEVMARKVTNQYGAVDHRILYDGIGGNGSAWANVGRQNYGMELNFGSPVSFNSYYLETAGNSQVAIQVPAGNDWVTVHTSNESSGARSQSIGQNYIADKVRVFSTSVSSASMREFRLGNGPSNPAPTIDQSGIVANLGNAHQQVQLTATRSTHYTSDPLAFELVPGRGAIPEGATLSRDGVLSLPPEEDIDGYHWAFYVKVTDGLGFSSEKQLEVSAPNMASPAANRLPVSVKNGTTDLDFVLAYDDLMTTASGYTVNTTGPVFDFGRPVSFDKFLINKTGSTAFQIQIENGADWTTIATVTATGDQVIRLSDTYVTRKVRIIRGSGSGYVTAFRLGAGPVYEAPAFVTGAGLATLSDAESTVQLEATYSSNYTNPPTYTVVSGALPEGARLDPNGTLHLPSRHNVEGFNWQFTVRAHDGYKYDERTFFVGTPASSAATTLPVSVSGVTGATVTSMYDDPSANTLFTMAPETWLTIDFGETPVAASSLFLRRSDTGQRAYELQVQVGSTWHYVGSWQIGTGNQTIPIPGNAPVVGKKFRIKNTWSSGASMRSVKLGANGEFPSP